MITSKKQIEKDTKSSLQFPWSCGTQLSQKVACSCRVVLLDRLTSRAVAAAGSPLFSSFLGSSSRLFPWATAPLPAPALRSALPWAAAAAGGRKGKGSRTCGHHPCRAQRRNLSHLRFPSLSRACEITGNTRPAVVEAVDEEQ